MNPAGPKGTPVHSSFAKAGWLQVVLAQGFNRGEYFDKILGGSIYSTNLYQTMTYMILQ
jgi:hypothetical protein